MLSRFSVKRPYVIIVMVIVSLILGGVSLSKMKTDLLPDMDIPYLAVITTDPGASAEKVEDEVTDVLESKLSTVSGVSKVHSTSSDNVSMVFLEFQDGTNMDSAMVKVSSAVNELSSSLPDGVGTPNLMEMSMDMMASMYLSVSYDKHDIYETSSFVDETVVPALERVDGVADASTTGSAEKSVEVRLDDDKIEQINNKLLSHVNSKLYDSKKEIDKGKSQVASAESQLKKAKKELQKKQDKTFDELGKADSQLTAGIAGQTSVASAYASQIATLQAQSKSLEAQMEAATTEEEKAAIQAQIDALNKQVQEAQAAQKKASDGLAKLTETKSQTTTGSLSAATGFADGAAQIADSEAALASSKSQLKEAEKQYKEARKTALKNANIDKLVDKATLAQMIKAQNFSMPAGYVDDKDDNQWLLRVGDNITSSKELKNLLLTRIDGVGSIRLSDVADVTTVDNVGDSYMKVNGEDGVMISVFKNSTASTSEVSNQVKDQIASLEQANPGLTIAVMSDQGAAIDNYISTVLQSLLLGALLAIVVLALFLRDWKPTVIVAFSIPFSVLLALLIMYFTGIDLNIMSLGGLSIAIGMLVDNSVVVMENIYRLRSRGIPAARAAVQGAKQITAAVVASTLTTICVFLPMVFTTGMVNQMLMPFALTIAYVLCASLVVALTLVPAVSSMVFKNYEPKPNHAFEKVQELYGRSLAWALRHKVVPLGLATVLLVVSVAGVVNMGITMVPDMTTKTISVPLQLDDDTEKDDAYQMADEIMERSMKIDGLTLVGAMDGTVAVSSVSSDAAQASDKFVTSLQFYAQTDPEKVTTEEQVFAIRDQIQQIAADVTGLDVEAVASDSSMSSMMGSGLSLTLSGPNADELEKLSHKVMKVVKQVEGYEKVENGMEDASKELHLAIDRDKLTKAGYTVAQLYSDLSGKVSESTDATQITMNDTDVDVTVVDKTASVTKENLLNTKIKIDQTQEDGSTKTKTYKLRDFATVEQTTASPTVSHLNGQRTMTVTADVKDGYNNALLSRQLTEKLDTLEIPEGYSVTTAGEIENINTMIEQMLLLLLLGFVLIYLVMVAQFQSLLSPFIILFTVPLAFTGGFIGLWAANEQLTMLSLMGFAVLMGTVVNNGIVFVDYVNQLRIGGLEKRDALVATGRTRLRPILMTALTTILAMVPMIVSTQVGSSMERGMALVVAGGLLYATFTTLYVVPIMYDLLYRKQPREVDLGDESIDDDPGDAQAFLEALRGSHAARPAAALAGEVAQDGETKGRHASVASATSSKGISSEPTQVMDAVVADAEERGFKKKPRWFGRKK